MSPAPHRLVLIVRLLFVLGFPCVPGLAATRPAATTRPLSEQRRAFQAQELIPAAPPSFVFNAGSPPRIVWRDLEEVTRLGVPGPLRVRWFDADLNEIAMPQPPGRWGAFIEGTAPNTTPLRRALTFYCRHPGFFIYTPKVPGPIPYQPGPIAEQVWREHQDELQGSFEGMLLHSLSSTEAGAVLIAGLAESKPAGRPPLSIDRAAVRNDDYHLALKLKVLGLREKVRPLAPPRKRTGPPAPVLHEGSAEEAGMRPDAKAKIDFLCRAWAEESGEPFVTLVARHGVVVTHEAFGRDFLAQPITRDYRADVASITKTVTATLFSQFLEQGLIRLDDSLATVLPDYPKNDPHVPTFRQCLTHTSGLSGHGDFGGVRNPHLDNIILNAIDTNEPAKAYLYTGMGFDLVAEAMEIVTGKSALRLFYDHLFQPLQMGDVPMDNASSGAQFTAWQLGILAQYLANRGSYGGLEFVSPETFETLLPEPLGDRYLGIKEVEGIGMHWMKHPKPAASTTRPQELILSPRTIGHGSLSSSMFLIDLERDLVIVQIRRTAGEKFADFSPRFLQLVSDSVVPTDSAGASN